MLHDVACHVLQIVCINTADINLVYKQFLFFFPKSGKLKNVLF